MPLEILGPLVIVGIGIVLLAVKLTVNASEKLLTSPKMIEDIFSADFPTTKFNGSVSISKDQRVALLTLKKPEHCLGAIKVMGSKHLTRLLSANDIKAMGISGEAGLSLVLSDFTMPNLDVEFETPIERDRVANTIETHLEAKYL